MAKKFAGILCILMVIVGLFSGCKKFIRKGSMPEAGIALTFDDRRVDNWFTYLPFLDSAGVKATFYVSSYHLLTKKQKEKLAIIQNHGHEIAFHTTNHPNLQDYVFKYGHSFDELIRNEIDNDLKLMNNDGFYPKTFAYPYGAHNYFLDTLLMGHFKSIRALNGTKDYTKSIVATHCNKLLYGLGIDKSSKRSDHDIIKILESVTNNKSCAVFVAHDINTSDKFSLTIDRLKAIIDFSRANNLKYYTISEISN